MAVVDGSDRWPSSAISMPQCDAYPVTETPTRRVGRLPAMKSPMKNPSSSVVKADAADAYHRCLKIIAFPCLVAYTLNALMHEGRTFTASTNGEYLSMSGDSGLRMTLSQPMPAWMLKAHSYGALALVLLVLSQKEVVRRMASDYAGFARAHRVLGYATLAALATMDAAGYALCAFSTFEHFAYFAVAFAAPFALWLVGIWYTARTRRWRAHAFLSNMLLKGCIATPLSRLGGAALQRRGWPLAQGYYEGIFGVALIVGLWQAADIAYLVAGWRAGEAKGR